MEIVKSLLAARYDGGLKSMELMASPPLRREQEEPGEYVMLVHL